MRCDEQDQVGGFHDILLRCISIVACPTTVFAAVTWSPELATINPANRHEQRGRCGNVLIRGYMDMQYGVLGSYQGRYVES